MKKYYHATNAPLFDKFIPCDTGMLGAGTYFLSDKEAVTTYGDSLVTVELDLKNPWRIKLQYDTEIGEQLDYDHYAIEPILSLPNGQAMIEHARNAEGHYGPELQASVKSLGYDSIIGTYDDGIEEVVVFDPSQITIISFDVDYVIRSEAAHKAIKALP